MGRSRQGEAPEGHGEGSSDEQRQQEVIHEPAAAKDQQQAPPPLAAAPRPCCRAAAKQRSSLKPAVALLAAGTAAAAATLLLLLRQLRKRGGRVQRAPLGKHHVFSTVLALAEPSAALPLPAGAAGRLEGCTLVLSDRLEVQSVETRFGCERWRAERPPAARTFAPADALVAAGARGIATVFSEPMGLGPLLSTQGGGASNPAGKGRTHGGGEFGAAAAVAGGLADLALAVDELGSARVPAACCGAYALRTTAGVLPLEGAPTASHSLVAAALLAADPQALLKAGQALRLPGGGAATEVPSYLVAEDFFAACGEEMQSMVPAVVAAVKHWAGPDQAQALSLCEWLYHRLEALDAFMPSPPPAAGSAAARQQRSEGVLRALAAAAETLRQWEFVQQHGAWVEAHQEELPPAVVEYWRGAQQVDEARYRSARAVAGELQEAMRAALRDGYIFVLPTTPGPAPLSGPASGGSNGSSSSSGGGGGTNGDGSGGVDGFAERCRQFSAVAALSGVPQMVLPLPVPGGMPLSVSLLALHKRDLALLQAAAKLGPMLAEEAEVLAAQQKQQRRQGARGGGDQPPRWQPQASAAEGASGDGSKAGGGSRRPAKPADAAAAAAQAAAEQRKEDGNAAFRAGRYEDAVRQYSAAVQLHPKAAVYYANRAMAYLKLGSYSAAEADCDEALRLELSAKALLRRGSARLAQGNLEGARADFRQVLALEPRNRQATEELRGLEALEGADDEGAAMMATF